MIKYSCLLTFIVFTTNTVRSLENIDYYRPSECRSCFITREADYSPICGTDNRTYALNNLDCINKCKNTDAKIAYLGACTAIKPNILEKPKPGVSYSSGPQLAYYFIDECSFCYALREGPNWLCGSDGLTYYNRDVLRCLNYCRRTDVSPLQDGLCLPQQIPIECNCPHPFIHLPVCGTDGTTYESTYILECKNRCYNRSVRVHHLGDCSPAV